MGSILNSNWLDSYVKLMENTEPALLFDKWVAYSVVAAAMRRKVSLQLGRLIYFPNITFLMIKDNFAFINGVVPQ